MTRRPILWLILFLIGGMVLWLVVRPWSPTSDIQLIRVAATIEVDGTPYVLGGDAICLPRLFSYGPPGLASTATRAGFRMVPDSFHTLLSDGRYLLITGTTTLCGEPPNGVEPYPFAPVPQIFSLSVEEQREVAILSAAVVERPVAGLQITDFSVKTVDSALSPRFARRFRESLQEDANFLSRSRPAGATDRNFYRWAAPDPLIVPIGEARDWLDLGAINCTSGNRFAEVQSFPKYIPDLAERLEGGLVLEPRNNSPNLRFLENIYDLEGIVPLRFTSRGWVPDVAMTGAATRTEPRQRNSGPQTILFADGAVLSARHGAVYRDCKSGELFQISVR